jgi:MOSC domain-containing protein YiiM
LTVDGLTEAEVCIGDVWAVGTTTLQVTHPRVPCFRLSYRLGVPLFHEEQLASGRIGYLLRVLKRRRDCGG